MPQYPDANQWSTTHHVQISTANPADAPDAVTGERPACYETMEQTHAFDANFQKELLSEYKRDSKNKSQEYAKFLANKKTLITIILGQCDEATKTKLALGATYAADCRTGRLVKYLNQLRTFCVGSDYGGLSYAPYKQVVALKVDKQLQ